MTRRPGRDAYDCPHIKTPLHFMSWRLSHRLAAMTVCKGYLKVNRFFLEIQPRILKGENHEKDYLLYYSYAYDFGIC